MRKVMNTRCRWIAAGLTGLCLFLVVGVSSCVPAMAPALIGGMSGGMAASRTDAKAGKTHKKSARKVRKPVRNNVHTLSYNDEQRLKYFYFEAINQQTKGNYDAAFELLSHCLTIDPFASEVYFTQAAYYAELHNDSMALSCMERAAELDPLNDTYLERLAMTFINTKQYGKAIDCYEQVYANDRKRSDVLAYLLNLYNQQRNYKQMLHTINRIEQVDGSNEQTTLSKMRVYAMLGDKQAEYNELKELSDRHPNDMNYHIMMGNWLLQNNRDDEALKEYELVLREEPDNLSAKMSMIDYYRTTEADSLANELQEQLLISSGTPSSTKMTLMRKVVADNEENGGDSTQVLSLFKRMLAEPQKNSDMTELYAAYMTLKKMPKDSINDVLRQALVIAPDNAAVRAQLIQSAWEDKDFDEVISLSIPATQYNPEEMPFYYYLGMAYSQKDMRDEALDAFRRGVAQINEKSNKDIVSDFYAIMGDILHEKGRNEEAFAAYDSSLQYKPDNVSALNNYAYYLSIKGQHLDKAEQMSYRTIKAEPTNATFLDTYAWILFKQQRYEEAKIYIDQTLQNDSVPSGVLLEHAGDIYAMCDDIEKALEFWQQAVDAGNDSKILARKIRLRKYIKEE